MGTIVARDRADGSVGFTAVIRIKKGKEILHREAKTFSKRADAQQWLRHREVELENPGALIQARQGTVSLGELIRWYITEFEHISQWQRSKGAHLAFLEKQPIAKADATALTCQTLIDHVRTRRRSGAGPATVGNDLTWIAVVLRAAKSVRGLPVQPEVVNDARVACRALRLIAKSRRRERRPTAVELQHLDAYFERRDGRASIPMQDVMWFAIHSARREAEIGRLQWKDLDPQALSCVFRP
jgi:integrase